VDAVLLLLFLSWGRLCDVRVERRLCLLLLLRPLWPDRYPDRHPAVFRSGRRLLGERCVMVLVLWMLIRVELSTIRL
jgi:hypothetical protein